MCFIPIASQGDGGRRKRRGPHFFMFSCNNNAEFGGIGTTIIMPSVTAHIAVSPIKHTPEQLQQ